MADIAWIDLSMRERAVLLKALTSLPRPSADDARDIEALMVKIIQGAARPDMTVGVHGEEAGKPPIVSPVRDAA